MEKPAPAVRGRFFSDFKGLFCVFLCISSSLCRLEPVWAEDGIAASALLYFVLINPSLVESIGIEAVDSHDEPGGRCQMGVSAVLPGRTVEEAEAC